MSDDEYYVIRAEGVGDQLGRSRPNPLRAVLLFSSVVVAITALTVPELSRRQDERLAQARSGIVAPVRIDPLVTGSLRRNEVQHGALRATIPGIDPPAQPRNSTYTLRRSVLSGNSVCVIESDGSRSGNC